MAHQKFHFMFIGFLHEKIPVHPQVCCPADRVRTKELTKKSLFANRPKHCPGDEESLLISFGFHCRYRLGLFITIIALLCRAAVLCIQKQILFHILSYLPSCALTAEISFSCVMSFCSKAAMTSSSTVSLVMIWWMVTTSVCPCRQSLALVC